MRQEQFKMERQGLIKVGDVVEISEFQSYMNYSYIRTGCGNVRMLQKLRTN